MVTSKLVVLIWALPILAIIKRFVSIKKHLPSPKDTPSNLHLADPTSSFPPTWDVFLSFYGKDTRRNFISHLYSVLDQAGIKTFMDEPELRKGEEISGGLRSAIKSSKKIIVVISENYARSSWCLDELVEILGCKKQVIPVFYYVDPSDLRRQKGSFGEALDYHKKRYSDDMIENWKNALAAIAQLSGYHLKKDANEDESKTIKDIVENVARQVSTNVLLLDEYLFGIDSVVEEIYQKLRMKSDDVRAIGICGMGGIGKTTTAKAFYNKYSNKFDISCFIENIKQNSQERSLLHLLKRLLIELLGTKDYMVLNVERGIGQLKQILSFKRVLIVLDDLDQSSYLELLVRICNLFHAGSRIIITTRDANLLNHLRGEIAEVDLYMVNKLSQSDSLKLFSYHAFRKQNPPVNFREFSELFVTYAGGLPLTLKVLGSSLRGRTHDVSFWKDKLKQVQSIPENNIQKILQLSYDELENETQKAIFLDIAFFFVGKEKDEAITVFKSCGFFPDVGITILVERCLLTIGKDNKFEMHSLIQDMGRKLGKDTRLFLSGHTWEDLENLEEQKDIEGLVLDLSTYTGRQISSSLFKNMPNLRLLQIIGAHDIKGNFKHLFPKLRCIIWHHCPWTHMPSTFHPSNLTFIDMSFSELKILWKPLRPVKPLNNLCYLNMSECRGLKRIPDQLGDMKTLKKIDVNSTAIEKLPDSITQLKELAELHLRFCEKLTYLPDRLGEMKGLRELDVGFSAIKKLPDSITQLKELVRLDLFFCEKLKKIPEQIGNMEGLRIFNACGTAIEQLRDSFVGLVNLKKLYLSGCSKLQRLPEQLGEMQCLEVLYIHNTAIEEVPDSIGLLSRLQILGLDGCKKLKYVPESIWNLTSIQTLYLDYSGDIGIISLSDSVEKLNKLTTLHLSCNLRLCLPMILCIPSLEVLTLTDEGLSFSSAEPVSLSQLFNLRELTLNKCTSLGSLLPELPLNLKVLRIRDHSSLEQLPDLSSLKLLEILSILSCDSLRSILILPSHLRSLSVEECPSLQDLPDLSVLKELTSLEVTDCNNLKSISLKESSLQVGPYSSFRAHLPNREVAEWLSYKSSGRTVSFDIPPSFGCNFLGLALWVVYTCKPTNQKHTYIKAVITNNTESITENYAIKVFTKIVGEALSRVQCITGEKMRMKSGDKIKVSIRSTIYSDYALQVPVGKVKVMMCGVHMIQQDRLSTSVY